MRPKVIRKQTQCDENCLKWHKLRWRKMYLACSFRLLVLQFRPPTEGGGIYDLYRSQPPGADQSLLLSFLGSWYGVYQHYKSVSWSEVCPFLVCQMKSHRKQRELTAKSWDQYVSKTSNYEILKVLLSITSADRSRNHYWCVLQHYDCSSLCIQEVKAQRESSRTKPKPEDATLRPAEVTHVYLSSDFSVESPSLLLFKDIGCRESLHTSRCSGNYCKSNHSPPGLCIPQNYWNQSNNERKSATTTQWLHNPTKRVWFWVSHSILDWF